MIIVLGLVSVLAVIILKYVVPRLGFAGKLQAGKYIHLISRFSLDPKKSLWIVRVGTRHFLLGSGESAVNTLAELDEQDIKGAQR
jgi:flagellar biosynthetic protein FliO